MGFSPIKSVFADKLDSLLKNLALALARDPGGRGNFNRRVTGVYHYHMASEIAP